MVKYRLDNKTRVVGCDHEFLEVKATSLCDLITGALIGACDMSRPDHGIGYHQADMRRSND